VSSEHNSDSARRQRHLRDGELRDAGGDRQLSRGCCGLYAAVRHLFPSRNHHSDLCGDRFIREYGVLWLHRDGIRRLPTGRWRSVQGGACQQSDGGLQILLWRHDVRGQRHGFIQGGRCDARTHWIGPESDGQGGQSVEGGNGVAPGSAGKRCVYDQGHQHREQPVPVSVRRREFRISNFELLNSRLESQPQIRNSQFPPQSNSLMSLSNTDIALAPT
jgi:hypothetical protein